MKQLRESFSRDEVEHASDLVTLNCINGFDWKSVKFAQIYLPVKKSNEIDTLLLLNRLWKIYPEITTYVPVVRNKKLFSMLIEKDTKLEPGQLGLLEPLQTSLVSGNQKFEVIIVPTLAFDSRGYRLGYGKAHYDKFLSDFRGVKIGFAYSQCEVRPQLSSEDHDITLDYIATEKELFAVTPRPGHKSAFFA